MSAQSPESEPVDPLLKGSVVRFASATTSTLQALDVKGKIVGERLSPNGKYLFVATKKGSNALKIGVYKTSDGQQLYEITSNHFQSFLTSDFLVMYSRLGIEVYRLETGELAWKRDANVLFGYNQGRYTQYLSDSDSETINIFFRDEERILLSSKNDMISALSISSGETLWETKIPEDDFRCNSLNDSLLLLSGKDNYLFNVVNGAVEKLGIRETIMPQVLQDGNRSYAYSRRYLYCLDNQQNILWKSSLPASDATFSHLYLVGDTVVLINSGSNNQNGTLVVNSIPYIAAFNADNGASYWVSPLAERKEAFSCFYAADGIAYACSHDSQRLLKVSLADGKIQRMLWDESQCDKFKVLSWGTAYCLDRSTKHFEPIGFGFDCAFSMKGDAYRVSADVAPQLLAKGSDIYSKYKTLDNGLIYVANTDQDDSWIITPDGQPLYYFPKNMRGFYIERNSVLFFTDNKHYGIISFE